MSDTEQDGRYAPPRAAVEDVEDHGDGLVLASRSRRFGAAFIDGLIVASLMGIASFLTPWHPFDSAGRSSWSLAVASPLYTFILFLLVQGYLLATAGQTIGKRMLGLRIVGTDGSAVPFGRMIGLRYGVMQLFHLVPAIGLLMGFINALAIFRESRQCLHDQLADTIVIKA